MKLSTISINCVMFTKHFNIWSKCFFYKNNFIRARGSDKNKLRIIGGSNNNNNNLISRTVLQAGIGCVSFD